MQTFVLNNKLVKLAVDVGKLGLCSWVAEPRHA